MKQKEGFERKQQYLSNFADKLDIWLSRDIIHTMCVCPAYDENPVYCNSPTFEWRTWEHFHITNPNLNEN